MSIICIWVSTLFADLQCKVMSTVNPIMKATLKYLAGIAGPSGYGSKATADQIAEDCLSSLSASHLMTAIVTG